MILTHKDLIDYTDYKGPRYPEDEECFCVNVINDFYRLTNELDYDAGSVFYIRYFKKNDVYFSHRENNEPCIISPTGLKEYKIDGFYHRTNGPAVVFTEELKRKLNIPSNYDAHWAYKRMIFKKEEYYWQKVLNESDATL